MEPGLAVLTLLVFHAIYQQPVRGPSMVLCLILPVLMFPGGNRFGQNAIGAAIDILLSWIGVLTILFLLGYASGGLAFFNLHMLLGFGLVTPVTQWAGMLIGKAWLRHLALQPNFRRPAVIVGASELGARVARAIAARRGYGQDLLGFFEDRTLERVADEAVNMIRGPLAALPAYIEAHGIRDVYITLPLSSQPRILRLMESLQNSTASLYFVPDVFGVSIIQGRLEEMSGVPVVGLLVTPFTGLNGLLKRGSDLVLASLILLLISPVLLALAVGVKLSSPGPVIFKQKRTGLDGEVIQVYKFRSMTTQDNGEQVVQARRGDGRVTRFGAFIRRTSLDELPQFFNVLQGRMSIVGPRPHAVAHNEEYRQLVKAYMARHKVKPGITGWAQVNGLRGETDTVDKMSQRVAYDLEYLRNWSLGLDLMIIARTVKLMFFDRHAY
jgi:putative colanic acid biosynthesis UDP-glucose lipid carrier transferase